ncbi:cytochrome P450 [Streptomyces sp. NPDC050703]|uniref:cytochrome P450 n=1 Tax=Streptomyces sp. NPDC050703 TaxID=3157218 RepID=UPI003423D6BD
MDELSVQDPPPLPSQDRRVPFPQGRACPYHPPAGYAPLRDSAPLGKVTLYDGRSAWAVTGHAVARELLADPRLSRARTRPGFPEHDARPLPAPHVTSGRVASLRPRVERIVDRLLDTVVEQGPPAELVSAFALPTAASVIGVLLGVPDGDHGFFEACARRLLTARTADEVARARGELGRYIGELTDRERREPGDGLLDELTHPDAPAGPLGRDELVALSGALLAAGHGITAGMISLGVFTLLDHPGRPAALRAGGTPMHAVVEELLRYVSVADGVARVAAEDIEVAGHTIRSGEDVVFVTPLINRDGSVFARPDVLDWERAAGRHLAFGLGAHQCPAQDLARLGLETALRGLFERLPGLRLAVPAAEVRSGPVTAGVAGLLELPVAW